MANNHLESAVFGGGCFWCTEAIFKRLKGVESVISGYAGGQMVAPSYEDVSSGATGHAEVIQIEFDPSVIMYQDLLNVFFATHDPTTMNKQGTDKGTQYRSVIFYTNDQQHEQAQKYVDQLTADGTFDHPIVTEIKSLDKFYPAEKNHQNFYDSNKNYPYCTFVIDPKVAKLRQKFSNLLKVEENNHGK